jgi:hypothetical protein
MKTTTTRVVVDERRPPREVAATHGKGPHAGMLATGSWLAARGLLVPPRTRWEVTIALDVVDRPAQAAFSEARDTRFHIAIASTEWGFYFCHHGRASWIRVTDVPFVHERDDHALLVRMPPLRALGRLVRSLEDTYCVRFRREHAAIRSTITGAEPAIWEWVLADL